MNTSMSTFSRLLLLPLIGVLAPTAASAFAITLDTTTGNYRITYHSEDLNREVIAVFEPPTKVRPTVTPSISYDGQFTYSYRLSNGPSARQDLVVFRLPVTTFSEVANPSGWTSLAPTPANPVITWVSSDDSIKPANQLSGFVVRTSGLPGMVTFAFEGMANPLAYPDEPPEDVGNAAVALQREDRNSFVAQFGVGPSSFVYTSVAGAIDRLIVLKHDSADRGWMFGPGSAGIVKSLDAKLDAAKAAAARGQNKAASNQLKAFINELEAQRSKHLSDNAYHLLKVNAEFIIGKLDS